MTTYRSDPKTDEFYTVYPADPGEEDLVEPGDRTPTADNNVFLAILHEEFNKLDPPPWKVEPLGLDDEAAEAMIRPSYDSSSFPRPPGETLATGGVGSEFLAAMGKEFIKPKEEDMEFEEVLEILGAALPVVIVPLVAKFVNVNTSHWTLWSGRIGKLAGLLIEALDLLRAPKKIAEKVKDTGSTLPLLLVLFTMVGGGCSSADWKNVVDDSAKRVYSSSLTISKTFLPTVAARCTEIAEECAKAGNTECESVATCLEIYDAISKGCEVSMAAAWATTLLVAIEDMDGAYEQLSLAITELTKVVKAMQGGVK